jgi:hypothetical protein
MTRRMQASRPARSESRPSMPCLSAVMGHGVAAPPQRSTCEGAGCHGLTLKGGHLRNVWTILRTPSSSTSDEWTRYSKDWRRCAWAIATNCTETYTCWADDPIWCALVRDHGPHLTWSVIYRDGWEAHRRSTAVLQRRLARAVVERHRKPARCWFTEDKVRYAQWLGGSEIDRACGYVRFEWRPERVS